MKMRGINIINPETNEIEEIVEKFERNHGFGDSILYEKCTQAIKARNFAEIDETDMRGPIRTYLINWGIMQRIFSKKVEAEWKEKLLRTIRDNSEFLNRIRIKKLEETDLNEHEMAIRKCYDKIGEIRGLGSVFISKLLHLFCPYFFPMWDNTIRKEVSAASKRSGNSEMGESATGYLKFINLIQAFLKKYDGILSRLSEKFKKPKLKIVDEFMWELLTPEDSSWTFVQYP